MKFMSLGGGPEVEHAGHLEQSPTLEKLYTDSDLVKKFPFMPTQLKSIQGASPAAEGGRVR